MKIRLEGTQPEIREAIRRISEVLRITNESRFYPNEGYKDSSYREQYGRVYLQIDKRNLI